MTIRVAYLSLMGSLCFILGFLFDSWKDNLVILAIKSLFFLSDSNSLLFLER